jgi:hypothetical protein
MCGKQMHDIAIRQSKGDRCGEFLTVAIEFCVQQVERIADCSLYDGYLMEIVVGYDWRIKFLLTRMTQRYLVV